MAGGKGQVKRRSAKTAVATGEGGPMEGCTTKSKGAPMRQPLKERAPRLNAEEEAAAGVADGGKAAAAKKKKNRMPKDHVKWILAQKPLPPPPHYAALKERNPDLIPRPEEEGDKDLKRLYFVAKAFYEMEERFPKAQEWVRAELKTKGYVEVDEEWFKRKAEVRAVIDREWPKIQARLEAMIQEDKEYAQRPMRRTRGGCSGICVR